MKKAKTVLHRKSGAHGSDAPYLVREGTEQIPAGEQLLDPKQVGKRLKLSPRTVSEMAFHEAEYQRLRGELQAAHDASILPELPSDETRNALNSLLVRIRLKSGLAHGPEGGQ